jgi:hypothetical protein
VLWIGLGILYVVLLVTLGITSLRKGHWVMFILGLFVPVFWLIGALIGPTEAASRPAPVGSGPVG